MKRLNDINTSEISARIKASNRPLGHHVGLLAIFEHGRLGVSCQVCGGRWMVMDGNEQRSGPCLDLMMTTDGDGYCEEGATNYFDSEGTVQQRI